MSRQAEESYAIWWKAHLEECKRELVEGRKVYRVGYDEIEEGVIVRVSKARQSGNDHHDYFDDPNGTYIQYWAQFGRGIGSCQGQIYEWKWFSKLGDAQKKLAEKLRDRAKDCLRDASKWNDLAAKLEKESGNQSISVVESNIQI